MCWRRVRRSRSQRKDRRNSQLPSSSPRVVRERPVIYSGVFQPAWKGCNDRADGPNADAPQRLLRTLIKHALPRWRVNREDSSRPPRRPLLSLCPLSRFHELKSWIFRLVASRNLAFRSVSLGQVEFSWKSKRESRWFCDERVGKSWRLW